MTAGELRDYFRTSVVADTVKPYLWSDEEIFRYIQAAYVQFVRLMGGIADFTSDATVVPVVAGEAEVDISPAILRIMSATRRSDKQDVEIVNTTDVGSMRSIDYGQIKRLILDDVQGPVRYMVIGKQLNKVRLVQVPQANDAIDLQIYRLPLDPVTGSDSELSEVAEHHHIYLADWMKKLAYQKPDADTFNPKASAQGELDFRTYCDQAKREWNRYKHKTRVSHFSW